MKKRLIIIFLVWFFVTYTSADNSSQKFDLMDSGAGLDSSFIISILKDKQGFMWLGTVNGLVKYDGYRWTTYREELLHPKIPQSQIVVSLYEDDDGILWLGARNALIRFDRNREAFRHFPVSLPGSPMASFSQVSRIHEDPNNSNILWLHIINTMARFNKLSGEITYYSGPGDTSTLGSIGSVNQLQLDGNGYLWLATHKGLLKYDPAKDEFIEFRGKGFVPPQSEVAISISKSSRETGIFWIGYVGAVERYDIRTGASTRHVLPKKEKPLLITTVIESVTEEDTLVMIAWMDGLYKYNTVSGDLHHFYHDDDNPHSLVNDTVYSIFLDEAGTLWICTGGGLNLLEARKNRIETVKAMRGKQTGLSNGLINHITESIHKPGQYWIGTGGGLNLYDRETNEFQVFRFGNDSPIGANYIARVAESRRFPDALWLATLGGGLIKFSPGDKSHEKLVPLSDENSSVGSMFLMSLYESKKRPGCLWIGFMDKGMDFYDIGTGAFRHYRHREEDPDSISFGPVICFYESPNRPGILWVGTVGGGFNKFNMETERFTRFEHDPQEPGGLSSNMVQSIYESPREPGILWVGTTHGLNRFDMKKEVFTPYPGKARLLNSSINDIVEDQSGYFWITSFDGLLRYNRSDGTFLLLDTRDGFVSNQMVGFCSGKRGELIVGTLSGFNVFRPGDIEPNKFVPPVVITELWVANRLVTVGQSRKGASPILEQTVSRTPDITLSYRDRVFSFQYAALNYYIPEKNQYAYKMEGFEDDWNHVGNRRTAVFTGLPPGQYTFRVKGSNNDGLWNETGASIKVIINPPWWKTTWSYVIYGLLVLLLIISLNQVQRRILVRKERDQARLIEADLRARAAESQAHAMEAENQRKTQQLEEARRLQLSMLPNQIPCLPGIEIGVYMQTATEVGGDYYDFLTSDDGKLIVAFGDATGHGLNAGTMVSIVKGMVMGTHSSADLSGFFAACTRTMKRMRLGNLFMGLTLMQQREDQWRVISAGMPPIHVFRAGSGEVETFSHKTPPLGAFSDYTYTPQSIRLGEGDIVLLFSDGLPELFNGREEMFGYNSVKKCFRGAASAGKSPDGIIDALREAGEQWRQESSQDDDITFVVLKISETSPRGAMSGGAAR